MSDDTNKYDQYDKLYVEDSMYYTKVPESFKNRKPYSPPNIKNLEAMIPGTIVDIYAKVGQEVKVGEILMILEAMKMRNVVESPLDGEIKSIEVKSGDIVRKGAIIIIFK